MEIWHKRIKELRENTDVTLKDMAKIIGVSEATVQRYESGKIHELPYKVIIAYAEKFHVYPSYIMGWADNPDQYSLYGIEHDIDFKTKKTKSVASPVRSEPQHTISKYDYLIECVENDETIRHLIDVARTCTEDDIEMAIKFLKYMRIKG